MNPNAQLVSKATCPFCGGKVWNNDKESKYNYCHNYACNHRDPIPKLDIPLPLEFSLCTPFGIVKGESQTLKYLEQELAKIELLEKFVSDVKKAMP